MTDMEDDVSWRYVGLVVSAVKRTSRMTYDLVAFSLESYSLAIFCPWLNMEFYPLLVLDHLVPFAFLAPMISSPLSNKVVTYFSLSRRRDPSPLQSGQVTLIFPTIPGPS